MKKIYYLCLTCLIVSATSVCAGIFSSPADKSVETAFLSVESSVDSASAVKLAAVHTLAEDGGASFKSLKSGSCGTGYKSYNGKCVLVCDRSVYPFASKPSSEKGTYNSCVGETTYYGYTSCKTGWTLQGHTCVESDCSSYPYASNPGSTMGTTESCKTGTLTRYRYKSCNSGWTLKSGVCESSKCSQAEYPYPSNPGSDAGTLKSCKTGDVTIYGYSSCNAGWTKSGSYCNKVMCSSATYPYCGTAPSSTVGTVISCKSGSETCYGYSTCNNGWIQTGGYCNVNPCEGYTSTSTSITGCLTPVNCKKGASTVYRCQICQEGYKVSSTGVCVAEDCNNYTNTSSSITGCAVVDSCKKGSSTVYRCADCAKGYTVNSSGTCTANTCSGYTSSTATIAGCSSSEACTKGTSTVYKCLICETGFTMSNGACSANGCSGYSSTTPNITGCQDSEFCQSGTTKKYKCAKCQEGYTLQSNGTCKANTCASPYQTSATIANCVNTDVCMAGATKYYKCNICKDGFTVSNGACTANTCTGFGSATANIANCMETEFCQAGNDKKYKCVKCQAGYTLNSSGACVAITCATKYHSKNSAAITGCKETEFCLSGTDKYYACAVCKDGYTLNTSTGKCTANTCAAPFQNSKAIDNCVEFDTCQAGETPYYKCKTCKDGFTFGTATVSGVTVTRCTANGCSGFGSNTANIANCMDTEFCQAGNDKKYKCVKCQDGFAMSSGSCIAFTCAAKYHSKNSPAITGCLETEFCLGGADKYYTCVACKPGFTLQTSGTNIGKCTATGCNSPFQSTKAVDNCVEYDTCQSGDTPFYKCKTCKDGFTLQTSGTNIGKCTANTCTGYGTEANITGCLETEFCMEGATKKYKCIKCQDGYTPQAGTPMTCKVNTCTGFSETTANITGCQETEFCQTGTSKKYKCVKCQDGYTLKTASNGNPYCEANTCSGYSSSSPSMNGCLETEFCQAGASRKYKCVKCQDGFTLNNGTCASSGCPAGYSTSQIITGCLETDKCMSGNTPYYKCMMCKDGYTYNSSTYKCDANACTGYNLTEQQVANCKDTMFCMAGDVKKFKCNTCEKGFYKDGTGCKDCAYLADLEENINKYLAGESTTMTVSEMDMDGNGVINNSDVTAINYAIGVTSGCGGCAYNYFTSNQNIEGCAKTDFCTMGSRKRFTCIKCAEGYELDGGKCEPITSGCTGYTDPSKMKGCESYKTCKQGSQTRYTCERCARGYHLDGSTSNRTCRENHCAEYNISASMNPQGCTKFAICYKGDEARRKCTDCAVGYQLEIVDTITYDANETGYANGQTYNIWGCEEDDICVGKNTETTWYKNSSTLKHCKHIENYPCDGFVRYKCKVCNNGYKLNDKGRCEENDCGAYPLDSCPAHATCGGCQAGEKTKYLVATCDPGYHASTNGNTCEPDGPDCNVGDFVYKNKTCGPDYVAKTGNSSAYAIGIVVDKINRSAMTLCAFTGSENTNTWSHGDYVHPLDVPDLPNRTTEETAVDDYDGSGNTTIVHAYADSLGNPYIHQAFAMCYYNSTLSYSQYLPSAGELNGVHGSMDKIAAAYTKMGVSFNSAMNKVLWTSTEKSGDEAWTVNPVGGGVVTKNKGLLGVQHFIGTCCFFKY